MKKILNLDPKEVFYWFDEISKIPRESGNEKEISDFLVKFAKDRKLEFYQDEALNVIIKKTATEGYEKSKGVIIQGHIDMVCVKTDESTHDFKKDPINLVIDGDILKAKDTSLGGDDGIAIAYGLAILDSKTIKHPAIELLATTNEETGMDGAAALTASNLSGKILLNIDSEEEGIFLVSCAGGATLIVDFKLEKENSKNNGLKIQVSGLKGGHSGQEIFKQRGNAIKLLGRVLYEIKSKFAYNLVEIKGGTKHNVIPQKSEAIITSCHIDEIKDIVKKIEKEIQHEYLKEESDLKISILQIDEIQEEYTQEVTNKIVDFIMIVPDGVQYMSKDIENLVQTSLNNGVLEEKDGKLLLTIALRSSIKSSLYEFINKINALGTLMNVSIRKTNEYPAWEYEEDSKVRECAMGTYKELRGKDAVISAIHAGLECGLLKKILPNVDMISYGPNLYDVHSVNEKISIKSVKNVWEFTIKLLENLK